LQLKTSPSRRVIDCRLIIFVKAPRLGFVKTRLAETIGDETALDTYQTLVEVLLNNLSAVPHVQLCFTPADAAEEIAPWLGSDRSSASQVPGDLGERMHSAITDGLRNAKGVIIIGSDCPYVTASDIKEAGEKLEEHDIVIGPANDGGYWLIGMTAPHPEVFEAINWSTENVLAETLATAAAAGLSVAKLRELSDIDTVADLMRFHQWHQINQPKATESDS
jgi:uncharacterized protein